MWYYESLDFLRPCNAWAADSHRFAAGRVIWYNYALYHYAKQKSRELLPCTIMVQGSSCTISPSQRRTSVLMCKSSAQALHGRRLANDSQYHISRKFYLQTPPNRRPKKLRSDELPTGRIGLALRAPNRNLSRFEPSGITKVNRDKCEHRGTK